MLIDVNVGPSVWALAPLDKSPAVPPIDAGNGTRLRLKTLMTNEQWISLVQCQLLNDNNIDCSKPIYALHRMAGHLDWCLPRAFCPWIGPLLLCCSELNLQHKGCSPISPDNYNHNTSRYEGLNQKGIDGKCSKSGWQNHSSVKKLTPNL